MRKAPFWTVRLKPGTLAEVMEAGRAHVAASRAEPGCLSFDFYAGIDGSDTFVSGEQYVGAAAHQVHQETPYFKAFIAFLAAGMQAPEMDRCEPPDEAHPAR